MVLGGVRLVRTSTISGPTTSAATSSVSSGSARLSCRLRSCAKRRGRVSVGGAPVMVVMAVFSLLRHQLGHLVGEAQAQVDLLGRAALDDLRVGRELLEALPGGRTARGG